MSPHSRSVILEGKSYYLRFTVGALAEMSERFGATSPQTLALLFSNNAQGREENNMRNMLCILLRSEHPSEAEIIEKKASVIEVSKAMPVIAELFEKAFRNG